MRTRSIYGRTIGEAWLKTLAMIWYEGIDWFDGDRKMKEIIGLRLTIEEPCVYDEIIEKYGNKANIEEFQKAFFTPTLLIRDVDVRKNFEPWQAFTYWPRLHCLGIDQVDKIIQRLSSMPESKRAVISVILPALDWHMDYMPCIDIMHFLLRPKGDNLALNQFVYARGLDFGQKAYANLVVLARLQGEIKEAIEQKRGERIQMGNLDVFIGSAHIYEESYDYVLKILAERGGEGVEAAG
jgi:thymidylate synthase